MQQVRATIAIQMIAGGLHVFEQRTARVGRRRQARTEALHAHPQPGRDAQRQRDEHAPRVFGEQRPQRRHLGRVDRDGTCRGSSWAGATGGRTRALSSSRRARRARGVERRDDVDRTAATRPEARERARLRCRATRLRARRRGRVRIGRRTSIRDRTASSSSAFLRCASDTCRHPSSTKVCLPTPSPSRNVTAATVAEPARSAPARPDARRA